MGEAREVPRRVPAGADAAAEPIQLDNDLAEEFLAWSFGEMGNTAKWVAKQRKVLARWIARLAGVNVRRTTLRERLLPALESRRASGTGSS